MIELRDREEERLPRGAVQVPGGTDRAANWVTLPTPAPKREQLLTRHERKWLLFAGDFVALYLPLVLALAAAHPERPVALGLGEWAMLMVSGILWTLLSVSLSLYDLGRASNIIRTHRATICAAFFVFLIRSLYINHPHAPFFQGAQFGLGAVLAVAIWRTGFAALTSKAARLHRVLIVGAGASGQTLAEEMAEVKEQGYELIGFVDDAPNKIGTAHAGYPVFGSSRETVKLIEKYGIDTVVLSVNRLPALSADVFQAMIDAREKGVRTVSMPALYENLTQKMPVEHAGQNWSIMFPFEHVGGSYAYQVAVRILDLVVGIIGCGITLLLCPLLMVANKLGSPGPLFYSQIRVGKGGKDFRIYKFRSMVPNAESAGAQWCTENDPRITKVGNFLRKTRLDELPQFWNLVIGDMSLIGPRPERPEFTQSLSETIPFYRTRHAVKPGLTGWAQVMYRYGSSEEDSLVKLQYDLYYIKHRSPMLDLRILAKSLKVVISGGGR